eukprot:scaffold6162_cov93-Skeletonema_dohrnii-CCMP3373.AAC.2
MDSRRMWQHYAVTVDTVQLTHHVLDGNAATTNYTIYEGYSRRRGHSLHYCSILLLLLRWGRPFITLGTSPVLLLIRALFHHDIS